MKLLATVIWSKSRRKRRFNAVWIGKLHGKTWKVTSKLKKQKDERKTLKIHTAKGNTNNWWFQLKGGTSKIPPLYVSSLSRSLSLSFVTTFYPLHYWSGMKRTRQQKSECIKGELDVTRWEQWQVCGNHGSIHKGKQSRWYQS